METSEKYCSLCKNHCPLSNPRCPSVRSPEMAAKRKAAEEKDAQICKICDQKCPYTALQCETGKLMARIRGKLPSQGAD